LMVTFLKEFFKHILTVAIIDRLIFTPWTIFKSIANLYEW